MKTGHLSHVHSEQEYGWDTLHWSSHSLAPYWLRTANDRGCDWAAMQCESASVVYDLQSWRQVEPVVARATVEAERAWQAWITPFWRKAPNYWEQLGAPVWAACEFLIGRSGWWRIEQCARTADGQALVPESAISRESDLWRIVKDMARLSMWPVFAAEMERLSSQVKPPNEWDLARLGAAAEREAQQRLERVTRKLA